MPSILLVGDDAALVHAQAEALDRAGHQVEIIPDIFRARDRLSGEPCEVAVIDARLPDSGAGLLIEQAHAAWPACAVVALVGQPDLRDTKVHQMGLWTPDATLVQPVGGDALVRAIADLDDYRPQRRTVARRRGAAL